MMSENGYELKPRQLLTFVLTVGIQAGLMTAECRADIRAGAAQRDITPAAGLEIQHYFRTSVGVHDPLFARCLYLEDDAGNSVAIVCLDLIFGEFDACDQLREGIRMETGIPNTLINFSHTHSSAALGPRGRTRVSNDEGSAWNDATLDAIIQITKEAKEHAESVSLRAGRAASHVGFNRRLLNQDTGHVYMGVNREGPVVPWVNVLVADSKETGKPISVLFETAGHPVIVPHTTKKTSADFPGAAVKRIRAELGDDVIAMFGQGCAGNINGFPLRSSYTNAVSQGRDLGDSVLKAIEDSDTIESGTFTVKFATASLPSRPLPTEQQLEEWLANNKDNPDRVNQLNKMRDLISRGEKPPPRRLDAYAVMFGDEWVLTTLPHEMFCQYELWIDENAPFKQSMTFAYTNGYEGYIAVDEAWRMGHKGGYEAASLPNWGGQVHTKHFGPPAVGSEKIIKNTLISLWPQGAAKPQPDPIQPAADAPQPMTPAESASKMRLPEGFRIDLVASEPLIEDPSCIAFDERGQLFVCELHGYNIEGHIDVTELNKTGVLDKKVRRVRWEFLGGKIADEAAKRQYGVVKMLTDIDGDGLLSDLLDDVIVNDWGYVQTMDERIAEDPHPENYAPERYRMILTEVHVRQLPLVERGHRVEMVERDGQQVVEVHDAQGHVVTMIQTVALAFADSSGSRYFQVRNRANQPIAYFDEQGALMIPSPETGSGIYRTQNGVTIHAEDLIPENKYVTYIDRHQDEVIQGFQLSLPRDPDSRQLVINDVRRMVSFILMDPGHYVGRGETGRYRGPLYARQEDYDYLVQEHDVDADRIFLVGFSRGAVLSSIAGAAETRLTGVALLHGGHFGQLVQSHRPAACPANYIGRISPRPVLMFNTTNDAYFLPEMTIRPWIRLARDPVEVHWTDTPHGFMSEEDRSTMLAWLRKR
ncbi:MAG: hypothetical protein IH892_02320 [Planctomycetes bacterium]|nr:hypothetical protein [Planctomycetota bacterium]